MAFVRTSLIIANNFLPLSAALFTQRILPEFGDTIELTMIKASKLKKYVELFNRKIATYLSKDISIKTVIHPVEGEGAVFEFFLGVNNEETIEFATTQKTVGHALLSIPQNMISGTPDNIKFGGTNLYLENNRVVVIKGDDKNEEWSGSAIEKDVTRVVTSSQGAK